MTAAGPAHGRIVARKRFGQHFLVDRSVLDAIVDAVRIDPVRDRVIEIGPGPGALTQALLGPLRDPARLTVIEIDRDLAARLRRLHPDVHVLEQDVLRVDWAALLDAPGTIRLVGNLPYNISSPLLVSLLPVADRVRDQHFMLQKEVVDRMVAGPGPSMSRLGVLLQAWYAMTPLFDVPPEAFDPPPRVQSAVVRMTPRPQPLVRHRAWLERVLAVAFAQRRKMLRNTLGRWLASHAPGFTVQAHVAAHPALVPLTDLQRRAESVDVHAWYALADALGAAFGSVPPAATPGDAGAEVSGDAGGEAAGKAAGRTPDAGGDAAGDGLPD